jgi:hypothetical protein
MTGAGGWTEAGPLDTLTLAYGVSCQGAGHALVAPAPVEIGRFRALAGPRGA